MIYEASIKEHRRVAKKRADECWNAYDKLKNKDSKYAEEILALAHLHDQVLWIYENASDSLEQICGKK